MALALESMRDITTSAELSRVDFHGLEFDSRIQGDLLVIMLDKSATLQLSLVE